MKELDFEKDIVLENDRVLLRPLQETDVNHLLPIALEDPTLLQYSPSQVYSQPLLEKYISSALHDRQHQLRYPFIIFDKESFSYAGSTSFLNISNRDGRIEIGATWIGRGFQRSGLNRHCKFLLMSYVFDTLSFERLEFRTDERNSASRHAIEKIGGRLEGILRSHTLMPDGFRRNTVCYSILRPEWPELQRQFVQRLIDNA